MCFLAKISLHRPTCNVRTLDAATGNLAVISRFHHFQISERFDFFSFFETLFFVQNYRFLYHAVIFLGLILLASKTKRGSGGPPPEKFFILRWLKPHFFNSEYSESGMTRNRKMVKTSLLHCDLSSRRSVCR